MSRRNAGDPVPDISAGGRFQRIVLKPHVALKGRGDQVRGRQVGNRVAKIVGARGIDRGERYHFEAIPLADIVQIATARRGRPQC